MNAKIKVLGGTGDPIAVYILVDDGRVYRLPYGMFDRPPLTKELKQALGYDEWIQELQKSSKELRAA